VRLTRTQRLVIGGVLGLAVGVAIGFALAGGSEDDGDATADSRSALEESGIPVATDVTGEQLPDVAVETLDGEEISLRDLTGRPLILNLWYSTCAPCVREMPAFEAAHQTAGDRVRIVGVNPLDSSAAAREFADDLGVTYELVRDQGGDAVVALGVARFPTTIFVDADGRIVATEPNELDEEEITQRIAELFPS
jgi:peroxiredoxin